MMIYKKGARDDFANYRVICLLWHSYYSRTPLIRPPSKSHWCGRMTGMVARDGFVYEQKPLSVTWNVVVWEGWSLVRVVVRQGFYCSYYPLSLLADWWRYWTITCQTPRRIPTSERVQRKRSRALRWFTAICDPSVQNQSHVADNINWVFHMYRKRRRWALIWCKKHLFVTIS